MDKLFICLANSYKRGGRCLAGVEVCFSASGHWGIVRDEFGSPRWVRPVSRFQHGEIPNDEAVGISLMTIIRAVDVVPCPTGAHAENVFYSRLENTYLKVCFSAPVLTCLYDRQHVDIFYNKGKAIHPSDYSKGNYSLMFICPKNALAYVDTGREKPQFRMEFEYHDTHYDFPITDPEFLDFLRDDPEQLGDFPNIFLTLSLGLEHEGWHHKLVAGVLGYTRRATLVAMLPDESTPLKESTEPAYTDEPSYMERQKQLCANAYAKWTKEDDALLWDLYSQGFSVTRLMERFGRNRGAIRSRLKKLAEDRSQNALQSSAESPLYDEWDEGSEMQLREAAAEYRTQKKMKSHRWKDILHFFSRKN
jgi:hypothetical protein